MNDSPINLELIENAEFQGEKRKAVNGRRLHAMLEVQTQFTDWMPRKIKRFGFIEGTDYLKLKSDFQVPHQGSFRSVSQYDYFLDLRMAQEVALIENNDQGRAVRLYFIEAERHLRNLLLKNGANRKGILGEVKKNILTTHGTLTEFALAYGLNYNSLRNTLRGRQNHSVSLELFEEMFGVAIKPQDNSEICIMEVLNNKKEKI